MERFYKEIIENSDQVNFNNIYKEHNGKAYLQLHANRTVWKLKVDVDSFEYSCKVQQKINKFEDQTGIELYLLGRSGRHVCVEINSTNIRRYQELRKKALELEKELVNEINDSIAKNT